MQSWEDCITGTHESSFWKRHLIESRLDRNGEVRWYITGKPYYEDALDDADDSEELLHYTEAS
jgi:hypothetical protein